MRSLTQADFLALWETGRSLHPLDQGVLAVQTAFPSERMNVADWPLGRRNRALAELRCASFGAPLRGWTACRRCTEQLEFQIDSRSLAEGEAPECDARVTVNGRSFRLPTSRDLAAVVHERDSEAAARRLLRQCCADEELTGHNWSEDEMEAVGEHMSAADPLAEILLSFDCPSCGVHFEDSLDLPSFLWAEIEGRAKRALMEVHLLASAYGWGEEEILSLSPARRAFYLEMVGS
ncbi:MAG: hypothetical protein WAM85_14255 [Terracidiphilus sp.]